MFVRKTSVLCGLLLVSITGLAFGEPRHVIQVGAFQSRTEALKQAVEIENLGFSPVNIKPEAAGEKGILFKVLVGAYDSRDQALQNQLTLEAQGTKGFVRTIDHHDKATVRTAIATTSSVSYFRAPQGAKRSAQLTTATTSRLRQQRRQILGNETTAPERLKQYRGVVTRLSDSDPGKAREVVMLGYLAGTGRSVYEGEGQDFDQTQPLLSKVAHGEIAATASDRLKAQEQVAHHLHYYKRDYSAALSAYREILAVHTQNDSPERASKIRLEIAAASYELVKTSGLSRSELLPVLSEHWATAITQQEAHLLDDSARGKQIRDHTARIGLMLSEVLIDQQAWSEAKGIAESLLALYEPFPELDGLRAEVHCHLAAIGIQLGDKQLCDDSFSNAIALAQKAGTVWGDPSRDPHWKAYTYRLAAAHHFKEPQAVTDEIVRTMKVKFADHPELEKYVGRAGQ